MIYDDVFIAFAYFYATTNKILSKYSVNNVFLFQKTFVLKIVLS